MAMVKRHPGDPDYVAVAVTCLGILVSCVWLILRTRSRRAKGFDAPRTISTHTVDGIAAECCHIERPLEFDPSEELDAQSAWAQGFGRFKHCGLRPEPLSSSEPPAYSLEPQDLPLPQLSEEERAGLAALSQRVTDMTHCRRDKGTLLRFLKARKGDVVAAEAYFRKAMRYWCDIGGPNFFNGGMKLEAYEQCLSPWWLSGGLLGHGRRGEVVALERLGRCSFAKMFETFPMEDLKKLDAVHLLRSLAAMEEDGLRTGRPLGGSIYVIDLHGIKSENFRPSVLKKYGKLVECRDMLAPCLLGQVFVVRAPRAFSATWSVVKRFLDPMTQEKVKIVSGRKASLELLRKYMDDSIIPAYLGGGLIVNGDPECRSLLAPGGPIPSEAIDRFFALTNGRRNSAIFGGDAARERKSSSGPIDCQGCSLPLRRFIGGLLSKVSFCQ
mmetsp:Transcript_46366/g.110409  ORF Transcript_46366/g.110409 Transcript_46366/m.110409 type:complete len:440 (+) Transcript_46366:103-1422(+)